MSWRHRQMLMQQFREIVSFCAADPGTLDWFAADDENSFEPDFCISLHETNEA